MFFLGRIANYYYNRKRNIFHYRDGNGWRRADPVAVGVSLEEQCPTYLDLLATLQVDPLDTPPGAVRESINKQRRDAARKLADAARDIFDLRPLAQPGGVTDGECIETLTNYFLFMESLARAAQLFREWPGVASHSRPDSRTPSSPVSGTAEN